MEEPDSPADPLRPHSPATKNHPPSTSAPNPKISAGGSGLSKALMDTAFIGMTDVFAVAPWVVGGVAIVAVLTSWFTLRRYLRV